MPEREIYRERAHLVALLAAMYRSTIGPTDPTEPEWHVVTINLPFNGQVTWHIAREDLDLFAHVRAGHEPWDGHSTALKYARIDQEARVIAERLNRRSRDATR